MRAPVGAGRTTAIAPPDADVDVDAQIRAAYEQAFSGGAASNNEDQALARIKAGYEQAFGAPVQEEEPAPQDPGFFSSVGRLAKESAYSATTGAQVSPSVISGVGVEDQAKRISEQLSRPQAYQPPELKEAKQAMAGLSADGKEAEGFVDNAAMLGKTILEFGKQVVTNPKGAIYLASESIASSIPSIVGMLAGAKVGAIGGSAVPGVGTAIGAVGGAAFGAFSASAPVQIGQEFVSNIGQALAEMKVEPTEANVRALLANPEFLTKTLSDARVKGAVTAGFDSAFTLLGGGVASAPARTALKQSAAELGTNASSAQIAARAKEILAKQGVMPRVSAGAKGVGIDFAGGGVAEGAGDYAATGEVDYGNVLGEMVGGVGGSVIEVPAAARSITQGVQADISRTRTATSSDGPVTVSYPVDENGDPARADVLDKSADELKGAVDQYVASEPGSPGAVAPDLNTVTGVADYLQGVVQGNPQQQVEDIRNQVVSKVIADIEARGGVASIEEASFLQQQNLGRPYDRIDPDLPSAANLPKSESGLILPATSTSARPADIQNNPDNIASAERQDAIRAERQAALDAQNASTGSRTPVAPTVDSTIEALQVAPAFRTAEQKIAVDQAQARFEPEDFSLLQKQAQSGGTLTTPERLRIQELRRTPMELVAPATTATSTIAPELARAERRSSAPVALNLPAAEEPRRRAATPDERIAAAAAKGRLAQQPKGVILTSDAKLSTNRKPVPGSTLSLKDGDTNHEYTVLPNSKMGARGKLIEQIARIFGKRLVTFSSDTLQADGFILPGDNTNIFVNANSQISPLAVFGHELLHQLRRDNPQAYIALEAVIRRNTRESAEMDAEYAGYDADARAEEVTADLVGNRFQDPDFWGDVFTEIAALYPKESRGIITRLVDTIVKAVAAFRSAFNQSGYQADNFVNNLDEITRAIKDMFVQYTRDQRTSAQELESAPPRSTRERTRDTEPSVTASPQVSRPTAVNPDAVIAALAEFATERTDAQQETIGQAIDNLSEEDFSIIHKQANAPSLLTDENIIRLEALRNEWAASQDANSGLTAGSSVGDNISATNTGSQNAKFSEARTDGRKLVDARSDRPDAAIDRADQESLPSYGQAREGAVSAVGRHYSTATRQTLSGDFYGRGMRGAETRRIDSALDQRIRNRVYFYVDNGNGISPEAGVGSVAHEVRLDNLYDPASRLIPTSPDANQFESAVIDAGFDGYIAKGFGRMDAVVLLGPQHKAVPVKPLGQVAASDVSRTNLVSEPQFSVTRRGTKQDIGDFQARVQKDGSLAVLGDAAQIRALIPENVVGRAIDGGILFTPSAAPRVRAALEGRQVAYSRAGEVVNKMPMKDGKYIGAPEKFNTPGKITTLRKMLRSLTDEGAPGRFWYENSGREVLKMVGGDVDEARRFVALLAIYSPQAKVDANSTFALRAWAQYKVGKSISVKTGSQDRKAIEALRDVDAFWSGEKTGNFFFNLLREIDPSTEGKQGATIDMWMMRAGQYSNDAPTSTQYAFMENETNRIAAELGWEPQQVQAAIWVAMKARMENPGVKKATEASSEKKGWIRFEQKVDPETGKSKKVRVIIDEQKHRDNWLKYAFAHDVTKDDTQQAKFDFGDGLKRHIGQVSFEARPGRSTGVLPGIHNAPYAQQAEFQQAVQGAFLDEYGNDRLAQMLGLLVDTSDITLPGVWQGDVSPSSQKLIAMAPAKGDAGKSTVDPAQAEALNVYAAVHGLVSKQEGVGWHRPFYAGTKRDANALDIDIGRAINPQEAKDLESAIGTWMQDNGFEGWNDKFAIISSPNGVRLVNLGVISNPQLQSDVVRVAENVLPDFDFKIFASDGDMPSNNWKENTNGESYLQRISAAGRPDVLEWARDVLAPRVQAVFDDFSKRYDWGDSGTIKFSRNRGGREGAGSSADRAVQTSERATSQEALASLPGAPQVPGFTGPDPSLVSVAEQYARDNGINLQRQSEYVEVDPGRAARIAAAYDAMQHDPQNPVVKEAFDNLIKQVTEQYKALDKAGYKFWFLDMNNPANAEYASSPWNGMRDLRANKQMGVFPTEDGFGSNADFDPTENPMLADTGLTWPVGSVDGSKKRVLANDLFRAVHDAFGHGLEGAGFRARGEENAWQAHARLFTGSAVGALTSETRGQNSWLNYGPNGDANRTAPIEETVFADQKTGLMPEWTWTEGVTLSRRRPQVKENIFGEPVLSNWIAPEVTGKDTVTRYLQDKLVDTKKVVKAIEEKAGKLDDKFDPYLKEELFYGRAATQTKEFLNRELKPLLEEMAKRDVTPAQVEEYMHNRHAESRNNIIAARNPSMPDGGSGIDTADARAYLSGLSPQQKADFQAIAKRIDAITKGTRDYLVKTGLETQDTINAWERDFPDYVPLFREEGDFTPRTSNMGTGSGFSIQGSTSKKAKGSKATVTEILANIAQQRERAIVRAEKNRVGTALFGLAVKNPNPDFWLAVKPGAVNDPILDQKLMNLGLDPADARTLMASPENAKDYALAMRINEEDHFVFFNNKDERAKAMVEALKNVNADQLGRVLGTVATFTRYFASVNTQYNPVFGMINLVRDTGGAALNLTTTEINDRKAQVLGDIKPAMQGIYQYLRADRKGKSLPTGKWAQRWEQFTELGGQTGYRDQYSSSVERAKALETELKRINDGKPMRSARALFDWLSDYNETLENAVRLAAFNAALDKGISPERSASIAKNLTVNFNRKGEVALQAGAAYAFFNASVQGITRMVETLRGPAGKKIIAGGLALGAIQALALSMAGYEDDDPPEFLRERNLIIPLGFKEPGEKAKYISIPMPLGFNVIPNLGRIATEWALDDFKDTGKRATKMMGSMLEAFNPIGNSGWSLQTITPTLLDPAIALAENRDFTGKPIYKKDSSSLDPTPGYLRGKDSSSMFSRVVTEMLNYASGGTEFKPGAISWTPDQIDYLIGQATGGVGREVMKIAQVGQNLVTGEETESFKMPIVGRFYGETDGKSVISNRFYTNVTVLNEHLNEVQGRLKSGQGIADYYDEFPEARIAQGVTKYTKLVSRLTKERNRLKAQDGSKDAIKYYENRIQETMIQLNDRVKELKK
jgi:hypothetical protein